MLPWPGLNARLQHHDSCPFADVFLSPSLALASAPAPGHGRTHVPPTDLDIERSPSSALYIAQLTDSGDMVGSPKEIEIKGTRYVTALAFIRGETGRYLCTTNTGLAYLDEGTGELTPLPNDLGNVVPEDERTELRFNDAYVDSRGRFYFHSMSLDESSKRGKLYMYERGMERVRDLRVLEQDFAIGNGPIVNDETNRFFFNSTADGIQCGLPRVSSFPPV